MITSRCKQALNVQRRQQRTCADTIAEMYFSAFQEGFTFLCQSLSTQQSRLQAVKNERVFLVAQNENELVFNTQHRDPHRVEIAFALAAGHMVLVCLKEIYKNRQRPGNHVKRLLQCRPALTIIEPCCTSWSKAMDLNMKNEIAIAQRAETATNSGDSCCAWCRYAVQ